MFSTNGTSEWEERKKSKRSLRFLVWETGYVAGPSTGKENTGGETGVMEGKLFFITLT